MAHTDRQTHKQTDGHGDSMTESAQWADSVKSLNQYIKLFKIMKENRKYVKKKKKKRRKKHGRLLKAKYFNN